MIIFFLKKLRKLFKSIGKFENTIIDKLVLLDNPSKFSGKKLILKSDHFNNLHNKLNQKKNYPKKLVIVICFFYNKNKIKILKKTLDMINSYDFKIDLTLITNNISFNEKKILKKLTPPKIKKIDIHVIRELPDNNLLPWYSITIMKQKFKNKSNSHFMFLEDDILISNENICYWVYFRKLLKKLNLVPGFLRYENYKKNLYSVDNPKKIILKKSPKIQFENNNFGFVNSKYPYSAMYLMDRDMMDEYLKSDATKVDFSFTNKFMKSTFPIKELLNISYAYLNVPTGFHNKLMIPYLDKKIIPDYCLIKHSEVKYANSNKLEYMSFGKIKIKDLIN